MADAINSYVGELHGLHSSGNAAYFPIPFDLLKFVDEGASATAGEASVVEGDPSIYIQSKLGEVQETTDELNRRADYMKTMKTKVDQLIAIDNTSTTKSSVVTKTSPTQTSLERREPSSRSRGPSSKVLDNVQAGRLHRIISLQAHS